MYLSIFQNLNIEHVMIRVEDKNAGGGGGGGPLKYSNIVIPFSVPKKSTEKFCFREILSIL